VAKKGAETLAAVGWEVVAMEGEVMDYTGVGVEAGEGG
jgi:hypothetical protein